VFLLLSPRFLAHSMNNPKDIPFAALYIFCIYHIVMMLRELPGVKVWRGLLLAVGIGFSCDIRISGLLLIPYMFLFLGVWLLHSTVAAVREGQGMYDAVKGQAPLLVRSVAVFAAVAVLGYLAMIPLWPYMHTAPLFTPVKILMQQSAFVFDSYGLYMGRWWHRWEIPWHYIPVWFGITVPLFVHLGLATAPLLFLRRQRNGVAVLSALVLFTAVFPVAYVILMRSNVYDDGRHLLFIYPPLIVVCALALDRSISLLAGSRWRLPAVLLTAGLAAEPLTWSLRNHPEQGAYFNPLIGGTSGAFGRYDIDFWGNSMRAAVNWIHENVPPGTEENPVRVTMWYGSEMSVKYYLERKEGYRFLWAHRVSDHYDYSVMLQAYWKFNHALRDNWPPPGTVHQVMAGGAPLCAVMKNSYEAQREMVFGGATLGRLTEADLIRMSLMAFGQNDPQTAEAASRKAIALAPGSAAPYNNLCVALKQQDRLGEAAEACRAALAIDPSNSLAANNLREIERGGVNLPPAMDREVMTAEGLVNLSVSLYSSGRFEECIAMCEKALAMRPGYALAYNNICSANNRLGRWAEAAEACRKALEIDPGLQLARNNLRVAESRKSD
jgi:tetratricopeptide (TPR) repeat protein